MRNIVVSMLVLMTLNSYGQEFITDKDFESKINERHAFGDDDQNIVVVEFWADFNKENAFKQLKSKLYELELQKQNEADSPKSKDKYRVRMAPTIIIYKDGIKEEMYKTRLDLLPPVTLEELLQDVKELQVAQKF